MYLFIFLKSNLNNKIRLRKRKNLIVVVLSDNSKPDNSKPDNSKVINTSGGKYYESINTAGGNYIDGDFIVINGQKVKIDSETDINEIFDHLREILTDMIAQNSACIKAIESFTNQLGQQLKQKPALKIYFTNSEKIDEIELANGVTRILLIDKNEKIKDISNSIDLLELQDNTMEKISTSYKGYTINLTKNHNTNKWSYEIFRSDSSILDTEIIKRRNWKLHEYAVGRAKNEIERDISNINKIN